MTKLTFTNCVQGNMTLLENKFIDEYMPQANGEYVKVYLLLLRNMGDTGRNLGISEIADILECTEKDVVRALEYWKKKGLLDYEVKGQENVSLEKEKEVSAGASADEFTDQKEFCEIRHVTEQYLGKTLTSTELNTIIYFYDELKMSADLIEYLIEYCVDNGHKSIHYIKKVALSWVDQGITTVSQAKANSGKHTKNSYAVLNAFGIQGRTLAPAEVAFVRRWSEEYGFSPELITMACNRTMGAIHQPSFDYTESILKKWLDNGVKNAQDVKALDVMHLQAKAEKKPARVVKPAKSVRKFNNFEGRTYENMDELTRRLLEAQ